MLNPPGPRRPPLGIGSCKQKQPCASEAHTWSTPPQDAGRRSDVTSGTPTPARGAQDACPRLAHSDQSIIPDTQGGAGRDGTREGSGASTRAPARLSGGEQLQQDHQYGKEWAGIQQIPTLRDRWETAVCRHLSPPVDALANQPAGEDGSRRFRNPEDTRVPGRSRHRTIPEWSGVRNPRAKRDFRMARVKRRVSGCFRAVSFAEAYCRVPGWRQTMAALGHGRLEAISIALQGNAVARLRRATDDRVSSYGEGSVCGFIHGSNLNFTRGFVL